MSVECTILLGGSFDPVHKGHIAIAEYFCNLFHTTRLRLIPAGNPWQKNHLDATPQQRIDMLRLAFDPTPLSTTIDTQEIERTGPSYTIDTLRAIRQETGNKGSLVFILGSDQLLNLNTWHEWKQLFQFAHIAVASRPGYSVESSILPAEIRDVFYHRIASSQEIRNTSHGLTYLANETSIDISATEIRKNLQHSNTSHSLIPPKVLDYIKKNNLYRN
ncbi:MAG: nicotinate-nucleotide adenylyltransferase [Betaproteobacteria bacterium]|nr:nicotinate-nucleotide adenylyltransferase [Betaproteobacteria bacterium]